MDKNVYVAIAMALYEVEHACEHEIESGQITIGEHQPSRWNAVNPTVIL